MQQGHAARTRSMDMQHGHGQHGYAARTSSQESAARTCSMGMQHWQTASTCSKDMPHGHTAWTCCTNMDNMDMQHGQAAWTSDTDMQNEYTAWTCSKDIQQQTSAYYQHHYISAFCFKPILFRFFSETMEHWYRPTFLYHLRYGWNALEWLNSERPLLLLPRPLEGTTVLVSHIPSGHSRCRLRPRGSSHIAPERNGRY